MIGINKLAGESTLLKLICLPRILEEREQTVFEWRFHAQGNKQEVIKVVVHVNVCLTLSISLKRYICFFQAKVKWLTGKGIFTRKVAEPLKHLPLLPREICLTKNNWFLVVNRLLWKLFLVALSILFLKMLHNLPDVLVFVSYPVWSIIAVSYQMSLLELADILPCYMPQNHCVQSFQTYALYLWISLYFIVECLYILSLYISIFYLWISTYLERVNMPFSYRSTENS